MQKGKAMVIVNKKLTIFMFCILGSTLISAAWAEDYRFSGELTCSKMGPRYPDNTDATGKVFFQLDEKKQELTYKLFVEKIEDAYMAHLHAGPCPTQGHVEKGKFKQLPIAVWLYPPTDHDAPGSCIEEEFTGTLAEGVIKPEDLEINIKFSELIEAMRNGNAYTNVHTKKYITGEICGQIKPTPAEVTFLNN